MECMSPAKQSWHPAVRFVRKIIYFVYIYLNHNSHINLMHGDVASILIYFLLDKFHKNTKIHLIESVSQVLSRKTKLGQTGPPVGLQKLTGRQTGCRQEIYLLPLLEVTPTSRFRRKAGYAYASRTYMYAYPTPAEHKHKTLRTQKQQKSTGSACVVAARTLNNSSPFTLRMCTRTKQTNVIERGPSPSRNETHIIYIVQPGGRDQSMQVRRLVFQ